MTWAAPSRVTRIQSRVLPLATDPPSRARNVWLLMLNADRVTSRVLSNTIAITEPRCGTVRRCLVVYLCVLHGVLQSDFKSWWSTWRNNFTNSLCLTLERLNLSLHMLFWSFAKRGGWQPIVLLEQIKDFILDAVIVGFVLGVFKTIKIGVTLDVLRLGDLYFVGSEQIIE